jgi:hypothetical protein
LAFRLGLLSTGLMDIDTNGHTDVLPRWAKRLVLVQIYVLRGGTGEDMKCLEDSGKRDTVEAEDDGVEHCSSIGKLGYWVTHLCGFSALVRNLVR